MREEGGNYFIKFWWCCAKMERTKKKKNIKLTCEAVLSFLCKEEQEGKKRLKMACFVCWRRWCFRRRKKKKEKRDEKKEERKEKIARNFFFSHAVCLPLLSSPLLSHSLLTLTRQSPCGKLLSAL